jgi:acetyl esterase/lipase
VYTNKFISSHHRVITPFTNHFYILLVIVTMSTIGSSAAQTLTFRDILNRADRPQPTHKIAYGADIDQYGELWLPANTTTPAPPFPVVILVHGGCWRSDLPGTELVAYLAAALQQRGIAVWSITYRRVGSTAAGFKPYPDTFLDVARASDQLRLLNQQYPLDLNRVVSIGHSAGGHLALWLAARGRLPHDSALYQRAPLAIHRSVGIAAIADLQVGRTMSAHACGADTVDLLVDSKHRRDPFQDTSVAALLPLGIPQTLISGVYDAIVAPVQALRYRERAKEKNEVIKLLTLDDAGHFELIAPWTPAGKRVVDEIENAVQQTGQIKAKSVNPKAPGTTAH